MVRYGALRRVRHAQSVYRGHNMTGWNRDSRAMCPAGQATAENGAACDPNNSAYVDASSHSWTGVTCNRAGNVRPACAVNAPVAATALANSRPAAS
jgi:hypothetical protein